MEKLALIASELMLSSYPLLIKSVKIPILQQTWLRLFVFATVSTALLMSLSSSLTINLPDINLFAGSINAIHIFVSYLAFQKLSSGNAMAIFYCYPLFITMGSWLTEPPNKISSLISVAMSILGMLLVAFPNISADWNRIGVVCALLAAVTEAILYFWYRYHPMDNHLKKQSQLYLSSLLILTPILIGVRDRVGVGVGVGVSSFIKVILFNIFIGFAGYYLRFYAVSSKTLSPVYYSSLSFIGIVANYITSYLFLGESTGWMQLAGSALIILANLKNYD